MVNDPQGSIGTLTAIVAPDRCEVLWCHGRHQGLMQESVSKDVNPTYLVDITEDQFLEYSSLPSWSPEQVQCRDRIYLAVTRAMSRLKTEPPVIEFQLPEMQITPSELDQLVVAMEPPGPQALPMRIPCPSCGELHVDEGEWATKLHHTHACQKCGQVWRPAVIPTVGVRFLPGFKNRC